MWYDLKFKDLIDEPINFTDWEKKTVDFLEEHKNIKKVWLVNHQRKTGATYFAKLLMFFRPPCTNTFVISHNLKWSKAISRQWPIIFWMGPFVLKNGKWQDGEWHKASNFLTPVTLYGLEKEVEKAKKIDEMLTLETESPSEPLPSFECLYDSEFDVEKYNVLCSYNFNFFIINVSSKDLEKARPFIEADKDKENVLIVNIENSLFPKYIQFINNYKYKEN